ncbi:hypothetical protein RJ639_026896 [Escallonia herrerae]|uniref:HIT domain-containing protein n=1 Tax=Escallonia herrerae TaxID=1293975 RepID=A0AA89BEW0_9ASTE|nr:hypothetical protein RJ639_026896 [Escallonia herrerae]
MAGGPSSPCIFCEIARSSSTSTTLLHTDDKVVAFQDIKPSAFRLKTRKIAYRRQSIQRPLSYSSLIDFSSTFHLSGVPCFILFGQLILILLNRHYLVIPVEHIATVKDLKRRTEDVSLVNHMLDVGQTLLKRDAPQSEQHRFGFHQPPFNSVNHLHLHCLALPFIPKWKHMKYLSLGPLGGFIEAEKLLEKIKPL